MPPTTRVEKLRKKREKREKKRKEKKRKEKKRKEKKRKEKKRKEKKRKEKKRKGKKKKGKKKAIVLAAQGLEHKPLPKMVNTGVTVREVCCKDPQVHDADGVCIYYSCGYDFVDRVGLYRDMSGEDKDEAARDNGPMMLNESPPVKSKIQPSSSAPGQIGFIRCETPDYNSEDGLTTCWSCGEIDQSMSSLGRSGYPPLLRPSEPRYSWTVKHGRLQLRRLFLRLRPLQHSW
jgi:hypothetical protein